MGKEKIKNWVEQVLTLTPKLFKTSGWAVQLSLARSRFAYQWLILKHEYRRQTIFLDKAPYPLKPAQHGDRVWFFRNTLK